MVVYIYNANDILNGNVSFQIVKTPRRSRYNNKGSDVANWRPLKVDWTSETDVAHAV